MPATKSKAILFVLCYIICSLSITDNEIMREKESLLRDDNELWAEFQVEYGKVYETEEERAYRKAIFLQNLNSIRELNEKYPQTLLGLNAQADTISTETKKHSLSLYNIPVQSKEPHFTTRDLSFAVSEQTPVKDQADCNASDVFASVAVIESMFAKKYEKKTFSEQAIINCCKQGCGGCKNDKLDGPLVYAIRFGLPISSDFKNTNKKGTCKRYAIAAQPTGIKYLRSVSEGINHLSKTGPFVASLDASCDYFKFYRKGILFPTPQCIGKANHSVAVIGVGTETANETQSTESFWIVKNSWGEKWGENGYGKILMGYNSFNMESNLFVGIDGIKRSYFILNLITFIVMTIVGLISVTASIFIIFISKNPYSNL